MLVIVPCALLALAMGGAWWSVRRVPDFYREALERDANRPAREGDELERRALELRNTARRPGNWQLSFSEDQINGWLAENLAREIPGAIPNEFLDPRVSIAPDGIRFGCRYRESGVDTVLSLHLDLYLTSDPQVIAAECRSLRAGWLPLPISKVMDPVTDAVRRHELPLRWGQSRGVPVALWTIPDRPAALNGKRVTLESLETRQGEILISGRSE